MGSSITCIKYLLFSFTFVFWLAGLAALGVGIWIHVDPGTYNSVMGKYTFEIPAAILMGAGALVVLVGFCGCCGAIRESKCLLGTFFTFLLIIFCAEIAAGVLGFLFRDKIKEEINNELETIIKTQYSTNDIDLDHTINTLQKELKCCGASGLDTYTGSKYRESSGAYYYPSTCCKESTSVGSCDVARSSATLSATMLHQKGCTSALEEYAEDHLLYIAASAIGIGCIQLLGMIFSCCLFFNIDDY